MSRTSITKNLIGLTVAGFVSIALLSPANASYQQSGTIDQSARATSDQAGAGRTNSENQAIALTSQLPWLAPVGHRQPREADVPQEDKLSAWEREQQKLDEELDRKLIICRGC